MQYNTQNDACFVRYCQYFILRFFMSPDDGVNFIFSTGCTRHREKYENFFR